MAGVTADTVRQAAYNGNFGTVLRALRAEPSLASTVSRTKRWTALHQAAYHKVAPEVLRQLVELGVDASATDVDGLTARDVARREGTPEAVAELDRLMTAAACERVNKAAYNGDFRAVVATLRAVPGAAASRSASKRWTALHQAAYHGVAPAVVAELITLGVDATAKDVDGVTAGQVALRAGRREIAELLEPGASGAAAGGAGAASVAGAPGAALPAIPPCETHADVVARAVASLLISGVGDALGYHRGRWELKGLSGRRIAEEAEALGGINAISLRGSKWIVSDDTVMQLATAEAASSALGAAAQATILSNVDGDGRWTCNPYTVREYTSFIDQLADAYVRSWDDMAHRAPGGTCQAGVDHTRAGRHWSKYPYFASTSNCGCGAAMRSASLGVALAGPHRRPLLVATAVESGRLSHNHVSGLLSAVIPPLFVAYALEGRPISTWGRAFVEEGISATHAYCVATGRDLGFLGDGKAFQFCARLWREFCELRGVWDAPGGADGAGVSPVFPEGYVEDYDGRDAAYAECFALPAAKSLRGQGWSAWDAYSCPLIAYDALLCCGGDYTTLMRAACIHSGDNDSTGAVAGAWFGAAYGMAGAPSRHVDEVEYSARLRECAVSLAAATTVEDLGPSGPE